MNANKNLTKIHFAPLQGYTDRIYRKVHHDIIGGVDYYYTPYLSIDKRKIKIDDIILIDSSMYNITIPQLLPANLDELKSLLKVIDTFAFQKVNINLGCPYPMVTRKGRGAALIRKPDVVRDMIQYLTDYTEYCISLKVRSGIEEHDELYFLLDRIPAKLISEIIFHPRTAIQLYKGEASINVYKQVVEHYTDIRFIYNGDIFNLSDYKNKLMVLPNQQDWMIGRGLLGNPFLAWQVRNMTVNFPERYSELFQQFIFTLIAAIEQDCVDKGHALNRVKTQLMMLYSNDEDQKKMRRKIKKIKELNALIDVVFAQDLERY